MLSLHVLVACQLTHPCASTANASTTPISHDPRPEPSTVTVNAITTMIPGSEVTFITATLASEPHLLDIRVRHSLPAMLTRVVIVLTNPSLPSAMRARNLHISHFSPPPAALGISLRSQLLEPLSLRGEDSQLLPMFAVAWAD
jgi:hypothetical protein